MSKSTLSLSICVILAESLNPLAKGLLSIFSFVIYDRNRNDENIVFLGNDSENEALYVRR